MNVHETFAKRIEIKRNVSQNLKVMHNIFSIPNFLNNIQGYPQMETSDTIVRNFLFCSLHSRFSASVNLFVSLPDHLTSHQITLRQKTLGSQYFRCLVVFSVLSFFGNSVCIFVNIFDIKYFLNVSTIT